jgi:predicted porin
MQVKRTAFGFATLAAVGSGALAQSTVQVYGIADMGVAYVGTVASPTAAEPRRTDHVFSADSGLLQSSRLGYRGTEDLGGGVRASFALEGGLALDTGTFTQGGLPFGRRATIGLNGSFGDLQIGRRKDFTDEVAEPFSSITPFGTFITRVHSNNMDRVGGNRANNMIYYSTPRWSGFRANVSMGLGESALGNSVGQSIGVGAIYNTETFGIGAGYWTSKLGSPSSDQGATTGAGCNVALGTLGDTCIRTWIAGTRYRAGSWHVHGTYSRVEQPLIRAAAGTAPNFSTTFTSATGTTAFTAGGTNNNRTNIIDVGVDYQAGPWKVKGSVIRSSYDFVGATAKGTLTQYTSGAEYYLSKRTTLYGTLAHMTAAQMYSPGILGPAPGADNSALTLAFGMRHTF